MAVVQVFSTLLGGCLINKYGRKKMAIIGGQIVTLSLFSVFIVFSFSPKSTTLLVYLIVLFMLAYSATIGVVPLIYLSELLKNLSTVNIIFWALSMVGTFVSEIMLAKIGIGKSFFIFGLISYICVFILSSEMIESKNKSRS